MTVPSSPTADVLATEVARLFFDRQMTKIEIASQLGISRFRVARLVDGALAAGLVRIEYRDAPAEDRALATAMEERFGLDLCVVAARADGAAPRLAGALLGGLLGPDDVVGIAWGSTLAAVVREIPVRSVPTLEVVQLAGSSSRLARERDPGDVARTMADRLGAACHPIFAPAFVDTSSLRDALLLQPDVADATGWFGAITIAVVGIGAIPAGDDGETGASSSLLRSGVLDDETVAGLVGAGAVGDLIVHPFDAAGRFVAPELADRAVAIGIEGLRAVPRVIAVAAGVGKATAIHGGLATGLIDQLVTDAPTVRAVLAID